jgi:7-cyano-7-deazaguanine reductase
MRLTARFFVRGGIFTTISAEHAQKEWKPQPRVDLAQFESQSAVR